MGRKKKDAQDGLLTPLELEIMTALWKLGSGTVHEVIEALPPDRDYAYTTISTILRILLSKEVVTAKQVGRQHTYVPELSKNEYEERTLDHVVTTVFDGEPTSLLRRLLEVEKLSKADLVEIKRLVDSKGKV